MSSKKSSSKSSHRRRQRRTPGLTIAKGEGREISDLLYPRDVAPPRLPELKHFDTTTTSYVAGVTFSGSVTCLSTVGVGTAANQRVGDELTIRAIDFRFSAYTQGSSEFIRLIIFSWNEDDGAVAPTPGTVLQSTGSNMSLLSPYFADAVQAGRLNVVFDKILIASNGGGPSAVTERVSRKLTLPVQFSTGLTTGNGKLYLLVISDSSLAGQAPNYGWWSRIYFDDD